MHIIYNIPTMTFRSNNVVAQFGYDRPYQRTDVINYEH